MTLRVVAAVAVLCAPALAGAQSALPSWNDTATKQAIVAFVDEVTAAGTSTFVPPAERVAVFDNDGTLWSEQPLYFQALFIFDRIRALAPKHPEWREQEPYRSVLEGDYDAALAGGEHALLELAMATHAGTTTQEFQQIVTNWIATAKHPETGQSLTKMVYQPRAGASGLPPGE